jgi:transposase
MTKTPIAVLGIDLGKNSCSLAGLDVTGAVVLRRRMTREGVMKFAAALPACIIAMEACCGAHYLGRTLAGQGHEIRLMSPEYVQPYVKAQKTDDRDAEAIAEAATRPTMRFVTLKSEAQLDLQVLHRARERLVQERTALINQLRAVVLERGVILPKGRLALMRRLDELMAGGLAAWRSASVPADCWRISARSGRASTSGSRPTTTSWPH